VQNAGRNVGAPCQSRSVNQLLVQCLKLGLSLLELGDVSDRTDKSTHTLGGHFNHVLRQMADLTRARLGTIFEAHRYRPAAKELGPHRFDPRAIGRMHGLCPIVQALPGHQSEHRTILGVRVGQMAGAVGVVDGDRGAVGQRPNQVQITRAGLA
jgi:hypothetical protein